MPPFIPPLTDEDRAAAFPQVEGHAVHDRAIHSFTVVDQLEWQRHDGEDAVSLDARGWIGSDSERFWFRAEGEDSTGGAKAAEVHLLYGRQFSRWWDLVAGARQDFKPGNSQTWMAVGIQGLAPYWFEVAATAYVSGEGQTQARVEVEYELLFTNRLVLQPLLEADVFGTSDPERGVGAGLSTTDMGLRLRYEVRRELAPYIGVTWKRHWGTTRDLAEAAGESGRGARLVVGARVWF
jgi:copper resistance protein B